MKTSVLAGSLLAASLAALASPVQAQLISADVVVRTGPVRGHVVVDDGYSTYRREPVVYERPARVIVVERVRGNGRFHHWDRDGYRVVRVYYVNGRYYDRYDRRADAREVIVYERDGHYYRDGDDRNDRDDYRDRDHDRDYDHHDNGRHHRKDHDRWDD